MTADTAEEVCARPPKVIRWFKAYCVFLCVLYLAAAVSSALFSLSDPAEFDWSKTADRIFGVLFLAGCLGLSGACLLPLVLRPRPWLWVYDFALICLGMTSLCIVPASLPLLIFWIKPETKSYFGRS